MYNDACLESAQADTTHATNEAGFGSAQAEAKLPASILSQNFAQSFDSTWGLPDQSVSGFAQANPDSD